MERITKMLGYLWMGIWFILTLAVYAAFGYMIFNFDTTMGLNRDLDFLTTLTSMCLGLLLFGLVSILGYLILVLILGFMDIKVKTPFDS